MPKPIEGRALKKEFKCVVQKTFIHSYYNLHIYISTFNRIYSAEQYYRKLHMLRHKRNIVHNYNSKD